MAAKKTILITGAASGSPFMQLAAGQRRKLSSPFGAICDVPGQKRNLTLFMRAAEAKVAEVFDLWSSSGAARTTVLPRSNAPGLFFNQSSSKTSSSSHVRAAAWLRRRRAVRTSQILDRRCQA